MLFDNVKKLCEERKISVWRLEKDLGFSNRSISKWNESDPGIRKVQKVGSTNREAAGIGREGVRTCWTERMV